MPTYLIIPEPVPGPTYRLESPATIITEHPVSVIPIDHRTIWRYIDLAQFLALLQKGAFYLQRADLFDRMDPLERSWGQGNVEAHRGEVHEAQWARVRASLRELEGRNYVQCWHRNDYESAAMWAVYGKSDQSIAITSSLARLCAQFVTADPMDGDKWRVLAAEVKYIDHQTEAIKEDNTLRLLATKNVSYSHEHEVRLIMMSPARQDFRDVVGVYVPIDVNAVIESVVISPRALPWFREVVEDAARTYGLAAKLRDSVLSTPIV